VTREALHQSQAQEHERALTLEVVARTVGGLVGESDVVAICRAIGASVRELLPDAIVITTHTLPEGEHLQIVQALGAERQVAAVTKLIGVDPFEMRLPLADTPAHDMARYAAGRLERFDDGLYHVALHKVPRVLCRQVERMLRVDQVWVIGLAWGGAISAR
jgi:hypothetical protein